MDSQPADVVLPNLVGIDDLDDEQQELIRESEKPFEPTPEQIEAERELIKKAEGKYSPEEVKGFITMGKKLAAKPVLTLLCDTIAEYDGDKSEQKRLIELGYLKGTSDGKIGRQSVDAIERFQRDHSLPPTGLLDGDTLAALLRK